MSKIQSDFELDKYGIHVRLVREEDAEFIVNLRTNPQNARFIGHTDNDVSKQINWIREYKKREEAGVDYYFIFFEGNKPIVLDRIYNIDWLQLSYNSGSWLSAPDANAKSVMICTAIYNDIAQDVLGLLLDISKIDKNNKRVVKFQRDVINAYQYGETEQDYLFISTPETRKGNKLKKFLGLE